MEVPQCVQIVGEIIGLQSAHPKVANQSVVASPGRNKKVMGKLVSRRWIASLRENGFHTANHLLASLATCRQLSVC